MNEAEREALKKILVALFLESPKRKALFREENTVKTQTKTPPSTRIRSYKLGEKANDK